MLGVKIARVTWALKGKLFFLLSETSGFILTINSLVSKDRLDAFRPEVLLITVSTILFGFWNSEFV